MRNTFTTLALCFVLATSLFAQERSRRTTEGTTSGSSNTEGRRSSNGSTERRRDEPVNDTARPSTSTNTTESGRGRRTDRNNEGSRTRSTPPNNDGNGRSRRGEANNNHDTQTTPSENRERPRNNTYPSAPSQDERARGRGRDGTHPMPPPTTQPNPPNNQNTGGWNREDGRWGDRDHNRYERDRNYNNYRDRYQDRYRQYSYNNGYYHNYNNWYDSWWYNQHRSSWSHTFVFNQYVTLDGGWSSRWDSELQVRTTLRQRTNRYSRNADLEFDIERIQIYENGRYLGEVRSLPYNFSRVKASVSRNGQPRFENMIYLLGSPDEGFELMNSDFNNSYLSSWFRNRRAQIASIDLRSRRVRTTYRSQFLNDVYNDYVSIPLVPESDNYGLGYATSDWDYYDNGGYYNDSYRSNSNRNNNYDNDAIYGRAASTGENTNATRQDRAPELPRIFKQEQQEEVNAGSQNLRVNRRVEIERDNQR